jgi:hypothetical protein
VATRPAPQRHVHLPGLGLVFDTAYDTVLATVARRGRLDAAIAAMAGDSTFTPVTTRLGCLRGVATLTAFGLAVEIGDGHRLTGRSIGAYPGLVPTESSPGASRSQGSITETGNGHARRLLIEAAWHHRKPYRTEGELRRRLDRASPAARNRGERANRRLHTRSGACTPAGCPSTPGTSRPRSRTPRSPGSWPAGAAHWPSSTTDLRGTDARSRPLVVTAALRVHPRTPYEQPVLTNPSPGSEEGTTLDL